MIYKKRKCSFIKVFLIFSITLAATVDGVYGCSKRVLAVSGGPFWTVAAKGIEVNRIPKVKPTVPRTHLSKIGVPSNMMKLHCLASTGCTFYLFYFPCSCRENFLS